MECCRQYCFDSFENVFFTDEKTFLFNSPHRKLWYKPESRLPSSPSGKYGQKIHVWGRVSKRGEAELFFFKKKFKVPNYQECLESRLLSTADCLFLTEW